MLSALFYLLLTITIVTKCADGYVVDNSASVKNEAKSQTDDTAYFVGNNGLGNHIRTSMRNVTAIDNAMEMPKPNDAADYSTGQGSDDALAEVETGELCFFFSRCFPNFMHAQLVRVAFTPWLSRHNRLNMWSRLNSFGFSFFCCNEEKKQRRIIEID